MTDGKRLLVISSGSIEASIEGRNAWDRLDLVRLEGYFGRVEYVFFPADEDHVRELPRGLTLHDVTGRRDDGSGGRLGRLWRGAREIHRIAAELEPDAVAIVDPFLSGLVGWSVARRIGVPWAVHLVSNYRLSFRVGRLNPMPFLSPRLTFAVESRVLKSADMIFADCGHYGEYAVERGADPGRVRTIPRYADPTFYTVEPDPAIWTRLGVPGAPPVVYVGRLSPEKYSMELLETYRTLAGRHENRSLVVLGGGGPLEDQFQETARKWGLEERVRIVRGLDRPDLASAVGNAGVLLATHAGYALLEAALVAAPVVAYDYEWHPELVEDGVTGLLVPFRDPVAMAVAADELLRSPERASALGSALRRRARKECRPEDALRALQEGYEVLVGGEEAGR